MSIVIEENIRLADYTTLRVGGVADFFVEVNDEVELVEALRFAKQTAAPLLVIGGGSNLLINDSGYRGLVIKNCIKGVSYSVHGDSVYANYGAGEILDEIVDSAAKKNYWGLENLSAIPGTVGATPIQNVGAYGVEVSSLITEVSAVNLETEEVKIFSNEECKFTYRNSFFKTKEGKEWFITKVVFKLSLLRKPNLTYGSLSDLQDSDVLTTVNIRDEITKIRAGKFPNLDQVGTAGSFFKNPIIDNGMFNNLKEKYPYLPGYSVGGDKTKVSLGWILDHVCNLRGFGRDGVSLYSKQALVLINESSNDAETINKFADEVASLVKAQTEIDIEREVTSI